MKLEITMFSLPATPCGEKKEDGRRTAIISANCAAAKREQVNKFYLIFRCLAL
jgi:hypothetical protein